MHKKRQAGRKCHVQKVHLQYCDCTESASVPMAETQVRLDVPTNSKSWSITYMYSEQQVQKCQGAQEDTNTPHHGSKL